MTQVVGSHETELFHNRLTHTLEVAQIARRMAERLVAEHPDIDVNPDVVETAALAHDIGHPPFGHIAEEELDTLVVGRECPDGFEGNAQSFRIVATLAHRSDRHHGLDLTRASLQALSKYPWGRETAGKKHRKYGTYQPEKDYFSWSRDGLSGQLGAKQTPEAMIMDWADDVAYALHDVEDFFRVGLVPLDRLARGVDMDYFVERTFARWKRWGWSVDDDAYITTLNTLISEFPTEPWVEATARGTMSNLVPSKINLYTTGLTLNDDGTLTEDPHMRRELDLLKHLTWTYVIESPALAAQQHGQRAIVRGLFEYYLDAVQSNVHALPTWARSYKEDDERMGIHEPAASADVRLACDVVASLSERQAYAIYSRITGRSVGTVLEAILR